MRYVLNDRYRFRGWYKLPVCVLDSDNMEIMRFPIPEYKLLLQCDGAHELNTDELTHEEQGYLDSFLQRELIREAKPGDLLDELQLYKSYPARYRREAHWSVTGACNLRCRHCFMSAPEAKHGSPGHDDIMKVVDQLAECGVFHVGITGGEPLIRDDFMDIIDALTEREIKTDVIYTNGWLVDEKFLDGLEERHVRPSFQLSYDGKGWHDFLRGIPGSEERTDRALKLLSERGYQVSVSMCLHKKNAGSLRETVNHLASLGVGFFKLGTIMELGEWADPELQDLRLSIDEALQIVEEYIPQYFEDNAPIDAMLCSSFSYSHSGEYWALHAVRECDADRENDLACPTLGKMFFIGADGVISPCMCMADCEISSGFPSLDDMSLSDILKDSGYVNYSYTTVGDVRNGNDECRSCAYVSKCAGGCRSNALVSSDNYYAVDPDVCVFHKHGWEERMRRTIEPAYDAYMTRNHNRKDDAGISDGAGGL